VRLRPVDGAMWARKCGAAPQWPSRIKVLLQSFMTAAVGLAVWQWMSAADLGYLDLKRPQSPDVLCLSEWPLRHSADSWWRAETWQDWFSYREDMNTYVRDNQCTGNVSSSHAKCSSANVPLYQMDRNLGIPLGLDNYSWRNDTIEIYGHLFLWMTICLWLAVTVHDLALLTVTKKDYIYDLRGIRNNFRCCNLLYKLLGYRCWKRLFRGGGIRCGQKRWCKLPGKILAIPLAPVFAAWAVASFFFILCPVVAIVFLIYPVRLSRALIFLNCIAVGIQGVVLALHSIAFVSSVEERQIYAVTWERVSSTGMTCTCGCMYPISQGRCVNLLIIGVMVAYKSFALAFRCMKGLRRSNWANLISVLFPVPLTVYEVAWTRPDGSAIQHRVGGQPVQGEMAFDAFALMDEQIDSSRTTVNLVPCAVSPAFEPTNWSTNEVVSYLTDLEMPQYCDYVQRNSVDGRMLLQLCRKDLLSEIGCTSKIHASRIRGKLGTFDEASASRNGGELADNSRHSTRKLSGPRLTAFSEVTQEQRRLEYIGCCGFPCRRGENGNHFHKDSDGETDAEEHQTPSAVGSSTTPAALVQVEGGAKDAENAEVRSRAGSGEQDPS